MTQSDESTRAMQAEYERGRRDGAQEALQHLRDTLRFRTRWERLAEGDALYAQDLLAIIDKEAAQ